VTRVAAPWGGALVMAWPSGPVDVVLSNAGRDTATVAGPGAIGTDARLAQVRFAGGSPVRAALIDVTTCTVGTTPLVRAPQPFSLVIDGATIHADRGDAAFRVYAPGAIEVRIDGRRVPFTRDGAFVVRGPGTPATVPSALGVVAYPVPFQSGVRIAIDSPEPAPAEAVVYDVRGRPVRRLWSGTLATGRTLVPWDGRDANGREVPSGVYFVRTSTPGRSDVRKVVRVR
jgi:hypothetical protein